MKRKLAILLAAAMTVGVLPANVMAASSNTINKTTTLAEDDPIEDIYLKIQPNDTIESGDSIAITIENAEFDDDEIEVEVDFADYNGNGISYSDALRMRNSNGEAAALNSLFSGGVGNKLPWVIKRNSKKEIEVILFPISDSYAGKDYEPSGTTAIKEKPYYYIPIRAIANGTGDIKIKIDANDTTISGGGTYTLGTSTSSSGSTTTTVDETRNWESYLKIDTLTIKEDVKGTFDLSKNNRQIRLRVNSGFKFDSSKISEFVLSSGTNADFDEISGSAAFDVDEEELTITLPYDIDGDGYWEAPKDTADPRGDAYPDAIGGTKKATALKIQNLYIIPEDDDEDYGDVNITVSGCNITRDTVLVGTRADYGFQLTVLEDPTTIYAGRFELGDDKNNPYVGELSPNGSSGTGKGTNFIDEDDCVSAEFKFEETIQDTWLGRNLDFIVPEGVKIYKYEYSDAKRVSTSDLNSNSLITNDGRTLRISKSIVDDLNNEDDPVEFEVKLYLSADPAYQGDVTVSVSGGGYGDEIATDEVIAKVVTPITVETTKTEANMGYQNYNTSDIVITEAEAGIFLKDKYVILSLDAPFGADEVGFSDLSTTEIVIDGDLEITNFKFTDGTIRFQIDKRSNSSPSTVTIKNVCVGTTRSVPYGSYDLKIGGDAVICNYSEEAVDDIDYPVNDDEIDGDNGKRLGYFDDNDSYSYQDYLVVTTAPSTLDDVVEVTIDEKTILINGESYDMDVAPYIQASSNSTMVPLRFVAIALGVDPSSISNPDESSKVNWNADTKTVTIFYGAGSAQKIVQFTAGSNVMVVDGSSINMEYGVVAEIKDDRMFVPFRALGQALGVKVTWNADTRTATYNGN